MLRPEPRSLEEIAASAAEWRLRFYCWRHILVLSVATAVAGEAVVAVLERRPPCTTLVITQALDRH